MILKSILYIGDDGVLYSLRPEFRNTGSRLETMPDDLFTEHQTLPDTFVIATTNLDFSTTSVIGGTVSAYGDPASQTVCTIPELSVVTGIHTYCIEDFNGGGAETIDLGLNGGATSGLLADAHIAKELGAVSGEICANRGALLWNTTSSSPIQAFVCAETDVIATVTNLATAGILGVLIQCVQMGTAITEYF
jgi:hypothetical protein